MESQDIEGQTLHAYSVFGLFILYVALRTVPLLITVRRVTVCLFI